MTLGDKLTQARKAAGLTQADAAAKLNVSRQAVSRWESGPSKPSTEKLLALGELYGMSIDRLLNAERAEDALPVAASSMPETVAAEHVAPEKHRSRAWLKYAAAVLCGVLAALFVVWLFRKSGPIEKARPTPLGNMKQEDVSDMPASHFDFTWD